MPNAGAAMDAGSSPAADDSEPFDPLSEGRASSVVSYTSLRLRGRVIQLLLDELRRRGSYSTATRRVSLSLSPRGQADDGDAAATRAAAKPKASPALLSLGETQDDLDELLRQSAMGADSATDRETLVLTAAASLWLHHRAAAGFRQWREVVQQASDPSRLADGVNLPDEARRILLAAETARQAASQAQQEAKAAETPRSSLVLSPRSLRVTPTDVASSARFSRAELDVLLAWAKQTQSKTFRNVDDASIREVIRHLRFRQYRDGEALFYEGEAGNTFYVVFQGTVAVFVGMHATARSRLALRHEDNQRLQLDWTLLGKRVFTYRTGDSFGETAMFSSEATRTASAVAVGPCEVCELHRDVYRRTLRKYHQQFFEQAQKLNFLQRVPLFRDLQRQRLTAIAGVLEKRRLNFGDALFTERVTALNACFLVLSGVVKVSTSHPDDEGPEDGASSPRRADPTRTLRRKRSQHGLPVLKVDLHTVLANEILALEALLEPNRIAMYSATAASAAVEVYVLRECDARSFVGVQQSALHYKVRQIVDDEARERRRRLEAARLAFRHQSERSCRDECEKARDSNGSKQAELRDSVDLVAATLSGDQASTRPQRHDYEEQATLNDDDDPTERALRRVSATTRGFDVVQPPSFADGFGAPYLPHLRAQQLVASSDEDASGAMGHASDALADLSVVCSPKMLSACARNFIFENSDTLTEEYVTRLSHQFPPASTAITGAHEGSSQSTAPPPQALDLSVLSRRSFARRRGPVVQSRTARDATKREPRHHAAALHDNTMHWDSRTGQFVLVATPESGAERDHRAPRHAERGSMSARFSDLGDPGPTIPVTARPGVADLHQQLRSTQKTARKLIDNHLKRMSERSGRERSGRAGSEAAFLHFFAD
ncbi:hypothetical protein ATCC90586_008713 [Pythium insidiosum]|nr:hypothetical protein ATCC90586_008713 [Pythium insidiosum]